MLAIVAALSLNGVIGHQNELPWNIPEDMAFFKKLTTGHDVIMGRHTFESLNSIPLKNRRNIILSRQKCLNLGVSTVDETENLIWCHNLDLAIDVAHRGPVMDDQERHTFIIGGGQIYKEAIHKVNIMYLTYVCDHLPGDTFFPVFDKEEWTADLIEGKFPEPNNEDSRGRPIPGYYIAKYTRKVPV